MKKEEGLRIKAEEKVKAAIIKAKVSGQEKG